MSSYKVEISKVYDREAHIYIDRRPWMDTYVLHRIISFVQSLVDDDKIILNIGSGPGWLESSLVGVRDFVSIDISVNMVKMVTKYSKSHVLCADGEHLPFRPGSFDIIIASRVIKFMDTESLIKEIKDALKNGGMLIAVFDCGDVFWVRLLERLGVLVDVGVHSKTLRTRQLLRMMKKNQLEFVKEFRITAMPLSLFTYIPSFMIRLVEKLDLPTVLGPRINILVTRKS
jgi:SAM-dependent methyltransferase